MTFQDHFSAQADAYARYRPRYPDALFAWLGQTAPGRNLAWDSGTGSGQAALGLRSHFERILATDASVRQIARAAAATGVAYAVARSEAAPLPGTSVDLVFVGQAVHWFELEDFYDEVRRVTRPGGVLALCGYGLCRIDAGVDALVDAFYGEAVGPYWPPERRIVEAGYRDLPFPFATLAAPAFHLRQRWRLSELLGYFGSWSAVARCRAATGTDPLPALAQRLGAVWGDPATRRVVEWPLLLRVGRVPGGSTTHREHRP